MTEKEGKSLLYRACSRMAGATQEDPVSENWKNKTHVTLLGFAITSTSQKKSLLVHLNILL